MDRSQPSRRSRSASPRREDRDRERRRKEDHGLSHDRRDRRDDRHYDRDTRREDVRDGERRREDDPHKQDQRSQGKSHGDKVVGGIRYKGDNKPRDKGERHRDEPRRKDRDRLHNDDDDGRELPENRREEERKKEKKEKKRRVEHPAEAMIKVTVNDRLGTKAQIPCYGSDNIGKAASI